MENRVYYGEYSLKHWIELIIRKNIELPDYQRHFVWKKRDVKRLIKSLKEKQFVQPVTIALYKKGLEKHNLILDGQQRLTSILLAYFKYFPSQKLFKDDEKGILAKEDDSAGDEKNIDDGAKPLLWQFSFLLGEKNTTEAIIERIKTDGRYEEFTDLEISSLSDDFFCNTFIGFSYIVPEKTTEEEIHTSFSKMFRNINYFGKKLDTLESRKSLYFQNADLLNFFDGRTDDKKDVLCDIQIMENLQPSKIDFVRYLALLSQYIANRKDVKNVLVGYSSFSSRESFYADYVSYVLGQGDDEQESRPEKFNKFKFSEVFPNNCWNERFSNLRNSIEILKSKMSLNDKNSFSTWIDADYWLFGLIYWIVFEGKSLNDTLTRPLIKKSGVIHLNNEIEKIIKKKKDTDNYLKNTNRLGYLRERLEESCKIYSKYVQ